MNITELAKRLDTCAKEDSYPVLSPAECGALVEALEKAQRANSYFREQSAEWERKAISNFENCSEMSARIEELESQRKLAFTASNRWADKFREAEKRIAEMESRTVIPVTYSENADADDCRKWAWEQVKGDVTTEGWTTGDNINYFGFFCWGWDMRRQYNEQRPIIVKLLDCDFGAVQHMSGGSTDYCNGFVDGTQNAARVITAAGIKVEGE